MKVQFIGKLNAEKMLDKLNEVIGSTVERLRDENGQDVQGVEVHDAEFTVKFNVGDAEEAQVLTVEHHKGLPEMFTWYVDTESGEEADNSDTSNFDAWTVAKARGESLEFAEVESQYTPEELQYVNKEMTEHYGDMSKVVYNHTGGFKVVQVIQKGKLIQEYKLLPRDKENEVSEEQ